MSKKSDDPITAESFQPFGNKKRLFAALVRDQAPMSSVFLGERFALAIVTASSKKRVAATVTNLVKDGVDGDLIDYLFDAFQSLEVRRAAVVLAIQRIKLIGDAQEPKVGR